ncbi:MAG TPA: energy transducer TonB [Candidatus Binatia bacterium]|nr:energy transducer TonB [Candidatus Binatia bacterium]
MLISATRTVSTLTLRALFYALLFVVVVVVHLSLTGILRANGLVGGVALLVSGAVVLGLVLLAVNMADWAREKRAARLEILRMRQGLPGGPCCVVWKTGGDPSEQSEDAMPWQLAGPLRARYPKLARRLGVEGVAVVEFEVGAGGVVKNAHCVYAWPSDVFFDAAREALLRVKFEPKPDTHVRFGASYRMPFVFRISGASKLADQGVRAKQLRPALSAAQAAVEKLRRTG